MRLLTSNELEMSADGGSPIVRPSAALYVSIVCAADGARFATVAASEQECLAQVASYVAEQAARQLWPPSVLRVQDLLATGNAAGAVAEYFRHAGERWDREWLVTTSLHPDPRTTAWSGSVPLPQLTPPDGNGRRV